MNLRFSSLLRLSLWLLLGLATPTFAYVVSGTYTGDGTDGRAINIGFQPDAVFIQRADTAMRMQVRVVGMTQCMDVTDASTPTSGTDRITALTSTGFTVDSDASITGNTDTNVNRSGVVFEYFAFNQVAGEIKVGSYTGNGTDNRSITGVGFQPDLVWALRPTVQSVWRTNTIAGDSTSYWGAFVNAADAIQALQPDGFQLGTRTEVNASGQTHWYIACKKVAGKFNTGTYVGTGATRSITGVGFRPEGLFIKRDNSTVSPGIKWASSGINTSSFMSATNATQSTDIINSLDANGFTLGATGTRVNGNLLTYHWIAWAPVAAVAPAPVITNVTSSTANGAYRATQSVSIQVTFDASVTVTGTPTLALNTGGSASYASGSPGTTLTFNYTIGSGQTAADLDYSATNSLALAGGTINATTSGTAATLTLPSPGAAGSLGANKDIVIDTTAPSIGIGAPSASSVNAGGSVSYTVTYADTNFNASTLANGNITLNTTGTASGTVGVSGSGLTRTVTISSITGAGTLGISIASGTASDTAGNVAAAAGPSLTFTVTAPASGVAQLGTPDSAFQTANSNTHTLSYTVPAGTNRLLVVSAGNSGYLDVSSVTFDGTPMTKAVERDDTQYAVDSIWYLVLGSSGTSRTGNIVASYATAGQDTGRQSYLSAAAFGNVDQTTPVSGAVSTNLFNAAGSVSSSQVVASSAGDLVYDLFDCYRTIVIPTVTAGSGQTNITSKSGIILDRTNGRSTYANSIEPGAPSVTMSWTSTGDSMIHCAMNIKAGAGGGGAPTVTTATQSAVTSSSATLGGNVTADGGASVTERGIVWGTSTGPTTANNKVQNGSGTGAFSGTVTGLPANTTVFVRAYAINSAGTSYGSEISFATPALSAPVVTGVTSSTANGAYNAADVVSIQVAFDASVTVTGTPTLALNSGGSASYASGSPGTTLTFNYTVGAGQTAADLDYSATNSLALAGGAINATTGGTAATLTLPSPGTAGSLGANKAIVIDTTAPTIGIGSPSVSSINAGAGSVTYTVTYADTNFSASTLANGNITLNTTGTASGTVGVSGSGLTRTVTISSITGAGTLGISIAAGTASDTAGNTAPAAGPSSTFTVLGVPGAPTIGTATAGNASASVAFTAPASNGGSAILDYTAISSPGGITVTGSSSPINVTGLTNGTPYTFTVTARNAVGSGAASAASNSVTPMVPVPNTAPSFSLPAGVNSPAGETWTARESNRNWISITSSGDGSKLAAATGDGQIYTSTDSGVTWTARESSRSWHSITSSADGSKLAAVTFGGLIYTSTDSGLTWTARDTARLWSSITSSADGSKLAAVVGLISSGQIYTSTDSGVTWTARESDRPWSSITSSADGSKLAAVVNGGLIYTSTDSGVSWTARGSGLFWRSITSSADGSKLAAVASGGQIYTSTDSGVTWTARESSRSWYSITSSADGSKLAAVAAGDQIYTSTDSGVTWTARESNRIWRSITFSADGSKLAAVALSSQIYTSVGAAAPYNLSVTAGSGAQTTSGFATAISPGPVADAGQTVSFTVTNNNNGLFTTQPAIASNGTLTFTPGNTPGVATVTVTAVDDGGTANGGVDTSASQTFTITVTAPPAPTVANITPATGPVAGGTNVTITGANLGGATAVTFGGSLATSLSANTATSITCVTPAHAAGAVDVVVTTPAGISTGGAGLFTYLAPSPEIAVYEGAGIAGTQRADNAGTFSFGSVKLESSSPARVFTIHNSGTENLTGLAVSSDDAQFVVNSTGMSTTLAPNATTGFTVVFSPSAPAGPKSAVIRIASNDADENPFEVPVIGTADDIAGRVAFGSAVFSANQGAVSMTVTLVRTGGGLPFSALVSTTNGTAQTSNPPMSGALGGANPATADYVPLNATTGLVNFAAGEMTRTQTITLHPKTGSSVPTKRFNLGLGSLTGDATLGVQGTAEARIVANDPDAPLLSVTNPSATTTNIVSTAPLRITGGAGDIRTGVDSIQIVLNGGAPIFGTITNMSNPRSMPWHADIMPVDGTNTLVVTAYDLRGNQLTVNRTFSFKRWYNIGLARQVPAGVAVDDAGSVFISSADRGTLSKAILEPANTSPSFRAFQPDSDITLTAREQAGYAFSHWLGLPAGATVLGNVATMKLPAEDLLITAVFVENPFSSTTGEGNDFQGTFGPSDPAQISINSTGWLSGTLTPAGGSFSGQIITGGTITRLAAAFMADGSCIFTTVAGGRNASSLAIGSRTLTLRYGATGIEIYLDGTQVGLARRARYSSTNPPSAALQGMHTVAMPAKAQSPVRALGTYPQGDGFGSFTTSATGALTYAGTLADGSSFTAATFIVGGDEAPFFARLSTPAATTLLGSYSGTLVFDATKPDSDVTGSDLLWIRPEVAQVAGTTAAALLTQLYTAGWPTGIRVDAVGARYNSMLTAQTSLGLGAADTVNGNAELRLSAGKLSADVVVRGLSISGSTVTRIPATTTSFSLTLTQSTGGMTGTFTPSPGAARPTYRGIMLQKGQSQGGYGYFISNIAGDTDPESGRATLGTP